VKVYITSEKKKPDFRNIMEQTKAKTHPVLIISARGKTKAD
jgi:hypothetical protein